MPAGNEIPADFCTRKAQKLERIFRLTGSEGRSQNCVLLNRNNWLYQALKGLSRAWGLNRKSTGREKNLADGGMLMKHFSGIRPTASLLAIVVAALLLGSSALYGQATGNVTGVVHDTTGASVPKAAVVLTNQETGEKRTTTSNGDGAFAFAGVAPGTSYKFIVTAPNFQPWESQSFAVRAGDQLGWNTDIKLQVGSATAAVTVEAQVDTNLAALDTGERSDVITAKDLNNLTVVGRDAGELVRMLPGYAMSTGNQGLFNRPGYDSAVVGLSGPTGSYSPNGGGPTAVAVLTDGVSLTDIATNSGSIQSTDIDMVSEIKLYNSSFSAAMAKGPAVMAATSKTGGAAFHGEAYFVGRDALFNSNDWYDNYLRQSRPDGRYLYPGGNIGGPILLPFTSFNRNRDKMFFWAGFEYLNQIFEANHQAISSWVPTMAERQGDFSPASLDAQLCGARPDGAANPNAIQTMCNANSYLPDGTLVQNYNAQPYANSSGVALVNWFPLPNADPFTNPFGYNYIQQVSQTQNGSIFHSTLSYDIDEKDKLFLFYGLQREVDQDPVALNNYFPNNAMPDPGDVSTGDVSNILSARYTRLWTTLTNEFIAAMSFVSLPGKMNDPLAVQRFNMNAYNCLNASLRATGSCGSAGLGNFDYLGMYKNGGDYSVPAIGGNNGGGYPFLLMPGGFYNNQIRTKKVDPILQDNVSWQKKNHFFEFGVYWETGTYNGVADSASAPQGEYTFDPGNGYFEYSQAPFQSAQYVSCENPNTAGTQRNSGANYLGSCFNPVAMIYEGYADSYQQTNFTPTVDMRYMTVAGFINDQWRLRNVTLNLGARIEHLGPWTDKHNNGLATFSDSLYNQQCSGYTRNCTSLNMPGITWYSQKTGVSNSVNSPQEVYFTPRAGVAWNVFGKSKFVLRGGGGVYRNQEQFNPYSLAAATAQGYKTSVLEGTLTYNLIDSQSPLNPPDFTAYTLSPTDTNRPIYYEYNFGIDYSAPFHSMMEVAYVGSHDINLGSYNTSNGYNSASNLNIICGIESGCPKNQNPNNEQNNLFTVALGSLPASMTIIQNPSGGISSLNTPEVDFFRPYPFYENVYQLKHNFYANYNSVQALWNKQAGMLTFGANYTFAKNLATASSYNNNIVDPVNLRNDYNPVSYDRTQTFNIHYFLNLGQRYKGGNRVFSEAANGWMVSGVSQVMSGFPLASENGENFSFGYGAILPVQTAYQNQSSPQSDPQCSSQYGIPANSQGQYFCVTQMNPTVWLGTPDVQLMPTVVGNVTGGPKAHQFVNPLGFGLPLPESNGTLRLPYLHGPAYLDHDVTLMKNFSTGEGKTLQLRVAAFNVFNHPLVSFNNENTNNLTLAFQNATAGKALTQNVLTYQNFGVADIKVGNRLMEMEAKFTF